ncbi:hypothetical protein R1flu_015712 [Riccia fluitans]|uniref:SREBP regulating gene protein n=1 Tax=Riccia fluitans TaxID=41844 RepID=A0ABD1YK77_9MARC
MTSKVPTELVINSGAVQSASESHTSWSPLCNSTVQGRHLRSDDRGYVCSIRGLNPRTGCCIEESMRYSYIQRVGDVINAVLTLLNTSEMAVLRVKSRCRHNSASLIHENAYVSNEHHCFVPKEQYPVEDEEAERGDTDFGDLPIVISSKQGQSCESACGERQKACKLSMLPALNKCLVLKKYLGSREACIASTGADQPSEVVKTAPKHMVVQFFLDYVLIKLRRRKAER